LPVRLFFIQLRNFDRVRIADGGLHKIHSRQENV
jgi:hypothetical protein